MIISAADWYELQLRETIEGADSVLDFIPRISPRFARPIHLREFANVFPRMEREPLRLCISVPRRHGKTEMILHGLAWWFMRHPEKTAAYISYSAEFAEEKSTRLRDLAQRAGLLLKDDSRKKSAWLTPMGGGLFATGVGGPLTGRGVDVLVIDDPHKNREEADSKASRDTVSDWFTSTGISSVEPGGSVIVCHTRWNPDDLIGRLSTDKEIAWEYINLPALNEHGEALWPDRWPAEALNIRRREVGEYDWASMFMGQPRPRGGAMFREPASYDLRGMVDYVRGTTILLACDPAATAKTSADRSAIVVGAARMGSDGLPIMYVLDVRTMQVELPALVRELVALQRAWQSPIAVEAVGGFKAVPQMLKAIDRSLRVISITPAADKFVRAQSVAAAWNDGRVLVPRPAPWVNDFVGEVCRFTGVGDQHDDQVDALSHCWNTLQKMISRRKIPNAELQRLAPLG